MELNLGFSLLLAYIIPDREKSYWMECLKKIYTIYAILIYKACKVFIIIKIICQTVQLFISTSLQQLFLIGSKKFRLHVHVCASKCIKNI